MDSNNDHMHPGLPPPFSHSLHPVPSFHSGRRSLPPPNPNDPQGPQRAFSTYPSSTLQFYYPSSDHIAHYSHNISHPPPPPLDGGVPGILPSISQSRVPSLRHSPSVHSPHDLDKNDSSHAPASPLLDNRFDKTSRNSLRYVSPSPTARTQNIISPPLAAPQPAPHFHFSPNLVPPVNPTPAPVAPPPFFPPPHPNQPYPHLLVPNFNHSNTSPLHTPFNSSLPSTKDVPLLSGKHDWGPWHSTVRTLILNANLLGHIADEPYPGATFDPGLWPTYPPVVQ